MQIENSGKEIDQTKALYENSISLVWTRSVWQKLLSPGVQFLDQFSPSPTLVSPSPCFGFHSCRISKCLTNVYLDWETHWQWVGPKTGHHFTAWLYKSVYKEHLKMLNKFESIQRTMVRPNTFAAASWQWSKFYYCLLLGFVLIFQTSISRKGRLIGVNQVAQIFQPWLLDAAFTEYQNRNGNLSESEGIEP